MLTILIYTAMIVLFVSMVALVMLDNRAQKAYMDHEDYKRDVTQALRIANSR